MLKQIFAFSLLAIVLCSQPLVLSAQTADRSDWASVKRRPLGEKMAVETKDGRSFTGELDAVSDSDLQLSRKGKIDTVQRADIKKVYRTGGGSRAKSAAIYGAIGAGVGLGAAFGLLGATGGSDGTNQILATGIAVGAGIGSALGAAIGGRKRTLIYEVK